MDDLVLGTKTVVQGPGSARGQNGQRTVRNSSSGTQVALEDIWVVSGW